MVLLLPRITDDYFNESPRPICWDLSYYRRVRYAIAGAYFYRVFLLVKKKLIGWLEGWLHEIVTPLLGFGVEKP